MIGLDTGYRELFSHCLRPWIVAEDDREALSGASAYPPEELELGRIPPRRGRLHEPMARRRPRQWPAARPDHIP